MSPYQRLALGDGDGWQAVVFAAEVGDAVEFWCATKVAREVVGPAVVAAAKSGDLAHFLAGDLCAAVAADVEKASQNAVVATKDDNRFAGDVGGEVHSRLRNLFGIANCLPGVAENATPLQFGEIRVRIP